MWNLLENLDVSTADQNVSVAVYLLIQAGISPRNGEIYDPDDQYGIEAFEIDIDHIRIVNCGVEYLLKAGKIIKSDGLPCEEF